MLHSNYSPGLLQAQRDWNRTYQALAHAHPDSNTALRRQLLEEQADLRRRAQESS